MATAVPAKVPAAHLEQLFAPLVVSEAGRKHLAQVAWQAVQLEAELDGGLLELVAVAKLSLVVGPAAIPLPVAQRLQVPVRGLADADGS